MKPNPAVAKGKSFPFPTAVVCWVDLLGYGAMISSANFNPLHLKAIEAMERLRRFHQVVATNSARFFPTLVINDSAVSYRDLSYRSASVTYDFLRRSWKLFTSIQSVEAAYQNCGARMVIAAGFRVKGRRAGFDAAADRFRNLLRKAREGEITERQAIEEASRIRPAFDVIPQLQANFAFTKAYLADQSGTRGGLGGSHCFVDLALFDRLDLDWLTLGNTVDWSHKALGMSGQFAPVLKLVETNTSVSFPTGISDGLRIAQRLTGDKDVLEALRQLKDPVGRRPRTTSS